MARFTLPRDLYHGKGALEALKTFEGKKAIICVGGGSMKRFGFLDKAKQYLEEAGMEVQLYEGIEPDPSVETVMKGAAAMEAFQPDWGKFKTTFQMIAVILMIVNLPVLHILTVACTWIALVLTVVSLVDYIAKNHKVLTEGAI